MRTNFEKRSDENDRARSEPKQEDNHFANLPPNDQVILISHQ